MEIGYPVERDRSMKSMDYVVRIAKYIKSNNIDISGIDLEDESFAMRSKIHKLCEDIILKDDFSQLLGTYDIHMRVITSSELGIGVCFMDCVEEAIDHIKI